MNALKSAGLLALISLATPAFAQVSDDVVKIGVLSDMSGLYADIGGPGSVIAAKMAVEDFGKTVLGKPIEIISADHQNKPDVGSTISRRWFDTDKVDTIVDIPHSATALAALSVTREKKKVLLLSGPAYVEFTGKECSPTTIHWTYDSYAMANGTARAVVQQGGDPPVGDAVRLKASRNTLLGEPGVGETWTVDGPLEHSQWGPQINVTRGVRNLPRTESRRPLHADAGGEGGVVDVSDDVRNLAQPADLISGTKVNDAQ